MGCCTTQVNQEELKKAGAGAETPRGTAKGILKERSTPKERQGLALRPLAVEEIEGPKLAAFLQKHVTKHSVAIESMYDALHMGEFKRLDKDLQEHRHSLPKEGFHASLNDEPLLVGLSVDLNLPQWRAFNRYN
jgi:hypothetical protein